MSRIPFRHYASFEGSSDGREKWLYLYQKKGEMLFDTFVIVRDCSSFGGLRLFFFTEAVGEEAGIVNALEGGVWIRERAVRTGQIGHRHDARVVGFGVWSEVVARDQPVPQFARL